MVAEGSYGKSRDSRHAEKARVAYIDFSTEGSTLYGEGKNDDRLGRPTARLPL